MTDVVRHEEQLEVGTRRVEAGVVDARKRTETQRVTRNVDRGVEDADVERVRAVEGDSGEVETLRDGSVSIPLFEEQLVVTKRLVVRERVIIRKRTMSEEHRVEADLRRERIEIEGDLEVDGD